MFEELESINERPEPFQFYTARDLWTDEHTSKQMLSFHLNEAIDVSSRNAEFINRSVDWIAAEFNIGRGCKIADEFRHLFLEKAAPFVVQHVLFGSPESNHKALPFSPVG